MNISQVLSVQIVADQDETFTWYSQVMGRDPDRRPRPSSAEWDVGAGGIQLHYDPARAGGHHTIVIVENVDDTAARLAEVGISGGNFTVTPDDVRLCQLNDPSGNVVILTESPGS